VSDGEDAGATLEAQNEDEEAARARVIDAMRSKFGPVDEGCNLDEQ